MILAPSGFIVQHGAWFAPAAHHHSLRSFGFRAFNARSLCSCACECVFVWPWYNPGSVRACCTCPTPVAPYVCVPGYRRQVVTPAQAFGDYAGDCRYSNVVGAVPGFPSGSPAVLLQAGGAVKRVTAAGVSLWTTPISECMRAAVGGPVACRGPCGLSGVCGTRGYGAHGHRPLAGHTSSVVVALVGFGQQVGM